MSFLSFQVSRTGVFSALPPVTPEKTSFRPIYPVKPMALIFCNAKCFATSAFVVQSKSLLQFKGRYPDPDEVQG